jgi:hypothetical protein
MQYVSTVFAHKYPKVEENLWLLIIFLYFFFSNSCHCFHSWHARLQLKVNKSIVVNYKKYNKPSIDARIIDSSFENGVDSWKLMDKTYAAQFTTKK